MTTADAVEAIQKSRNTKLYAYADDMVMASTWLQELEVSFNKVANCTEENHLNINID
jgi:hypothetical protein